MGNDDTQDLLRTLAGVILILKHVLARLPRAEIKKISEGIDVELRALEDLGGPGLEAGLVPYRDVVDEIIAMALRLSDRQAPSG
jgi:hypothetical protein